MASFMRSPFAFKQPCFNIKCQRLVAFYLKHMPHDYHFWLTFIQILNSSHIQDIYNEKIIYIQHIQRYHKYAATQSSLDNVLQYKPLVYNK